MFLQEAPADTFNYMVLGFGVIFTIMGIFIASLVVRFRNLNRDLKLIDDIDDKEQT
jgi:hypothetical protein